LFITMISAWLPRSRTASRLVQHGRLVEIGGAEAGAATAAPRLYANVDRLGSESRAKVRAPIFQGGHHSLRLAGVSKILPATSLFGRRREIKALDA